MFELVLIFISKRATKQEKFNSLGAMEFLVFNFQQQVIFKLISIINAKTFQALKVA